MQWPSLKKYFDEMYEIEKIKIGELSSLRQIWRSILAIQPPGNELDWPSINSYFGTFAATAPVNEMADLVTRVMASSLQTSKEAG